VVNSHESSAIGRQVDQAAISPSIRVQIYTVVSKGGSEHFRAILALAYTHEDVLPVRMLEEFGAMPNCV
jgi:hypothetical protein